MLLFLFKQPIILITHYKYYNMACLSESQKGTMLSKEQMRKILGGFSTTGAPVPCESLGDCAPPTFCCRIDPTNPNSKGECRLLDSPTGCVAI